MNRAPQSPSFPLTHPCRLDGAWVSEFLVLPDRYFSKIRISPPSAINLKGLWLEVSGFMTGMPITVTVEHGRIVGIASGFYYR
ncbi:SymE family type I addiction module toxin [Pectobacterium peruviense]|uniref:SymE family type I addiction module toxin n=1 Tax=Pectobacterium peruviense TaxID=2066479 RepID=UPI000DE33C9F|nr:SymE family type I addiction module toxin [Pectobacterium peruviense]